MPEIQTQEGLVNFSEIGRGHPVVLLHANLHCKDDYAPVAARLAERFRVISVDWPGHGDSGLPSDPDSMTAAKIADTLEELTARWNLKHAFFIGNSVGGFAAARLAIRRPSCVGALVLVNSGGFTPHNVLTRSVCRALGFKWLAKKLLPRLVRAYIAPKSEKDQEVAMRVLRFGQEDSRLRMFCALWRSFARPESDLRGLAKDIATPTLVVHGTLDLTAPRRFAELIHTLIPGSETFFMRAGHVPFVSAPEEFLDRVEPFLLGNLIEIGGRK